MSRSATLAQALYSFGEDWGRHEVQGGLRADRVITGRAGQGYGWSVLVAGPESAVGSGALAWWRSAKLD